MTVLHLPQQRLQQLTPARAKLPPRAGHHLLPVGRLGRLRCHPRYERPQRTRQRRQHAWWHPPWRSQHEPGLEYLQRIRQRKLEYAHYGATWNVRQPGLRLREERRGDDCMNKCIVAADVMTVLEYTSAQRVLSRFLACAIIPNIANVILRNPDHCFPTCIYVS